MHNAKLELFVHILSENRRPNGYWGERVLNPHGGTDMLPILLNALEGEEDALFFVQFYHKYKTDLYRYALSLLRDPHLAEDAVQTAWLKCVQHRKAFFAVEPPHRKAWMIVLLKRVCLTSLRQRARTVPLAEDWDPPAPEAGEARDVIALIRTMPEQYRAILELKFVLEWTDKSIAKELGLPVTTVSARIRRGRKQLQAQLIKEGYWHEEA